MTFHEEVMSSPQRQVLRELAPILIGQGFYLAGGTALAILLGHRRSVDLDWFRGEPIADPAALVGKIRAAGISLEEIRLANGTVHGIVSGVSVSLFEYSYPMLAPFIEWPDVPCCLTPPRCSWVLPG